MLLEEAKVKVPRAIAIGLIVYFGFVVPGKETSQESTYKHDDSPVEFVVPVAPIPPAVGYEVY